MCHAVPVLNVASATIPESKLRPATGGPDGLHGATGSRDYFPELPGDHSQKDPCQNNPSQGIKFDNGKRRASLLPTGILNVVIDILEMGAKKYALNNWQKVENGRTRYYDAALRHIDAWWNGIPLDEETGKHHLAHAICCLMFAMWLDGNKGIKVNGTISRT